MKFQNPYALTMAHYFKALFTELVQIGSFITTQICPGIPEVMAKEMLL